MAIRWCGKTRIALLFNRNKQEYQGIVSADSINVPVSGVGITSGLMHGPESGESYDAAAWNMMMIACRHELMICKYTSYRGLSGKYIITRQAPNLITANRAVRKRKRKLEHLCR